MEKGLSVNDTASSNRERNCAPGKILTTLMCRGSYESSGAFYCELRPSVLCWINGL